MILTIKSRISSRNWDGKHVRLVIIPGKKRRKERGKKEKIVISREVIKKLSVFSVFHL